MFIFKTLNSFVLMILIYRKKMKYMLKGTNEKRKIFLHKSYSYSNVDLEIN